MLFYILVIFTEISCCFPVCFRVEYTGKKKIHNQNKNVFIFIYNMMQSSLYFGKTYCRAMIAITVNHIHMPRAFLLASFTDIAILLGEKRSESICWGDVYNFSLCVSTGCFSLLVLFSNLYKKILLVL